MNTETTEPTVSAAAPTADVTPGTLIREARQAAHLSVDDLAAHTKLARATVEALERDDFGALLEPVYVRGYYRKCAKVLNLDEKKLIDAYAARVTQKLPQAPAKLRLASGTELGSNSRLPMAMGVLFVLIAIAVCAALWWVRGATTAVPKVVSTNVLSSQATDTMPPPPASADSAATPATTDAATPETSETAPGASTDSSAVPASASAPAATSAPTTATLPPVSPSPDASTAAAVTGSGPLLIAFNSQSWIRVLDANGRTLLNGLVAPGERRQLDGKQPFDLFIGAAPAVSVQFNGQAVDLKPYTRDNATARLTLPLSAPTP